MNIDTAFQMILIAIQCLGVIVTIVGFIFIVVQINSAQKNAMMSSLLSAVANHWMLIEERRIKIRSGQLDARYRSLYPSLEILLAEKYKCDLTSLAKDFLWEKQPEIAAEGKDAVLKAIINEFAMADHTFNLYEEEYIASKYLDLVKPKLWKYWDSYIRNNFRMKVVRNHWNLRQYLVNNNWLTVFPEFVKFVEKEYLLLPLLEN